MADKRLAAEVRPALWGGGELGLAGDDRLPPTAAELQAFLAAASRLPPKRLRRLISAVRAAAGPEN